MKAQRRPIASHPAFVPLAALWFAALVGLGLVVLPAPVLERLLAGAGLGALVPLSLAGRLVACLAGALAGCLVGFALGRLIARRAMRDPRPVWVEPAALPLEPPRPEPVRRPLRVREELEEPPLPEEPIPASDADREGDFEYAEHLSPLASASDEGFMILAPQSLQTPRPAVDLDALLAQFDTALAAFRPDAQEPAANSAEPGGGDPVHSFVARQTGTPARTPLGGTMPDHQAELRAALDKLARLRRSED